MPGELDLLPHGLGSRFDEQAMLKASDLKSLSRMGLLLLCARCVKRVEDWVVTDDFSSWNSGFEFVLEASSLDFVEQEEAVAMMRSVAAILSRTQFLTREELVVRCSNSAICTLTTTIEATAIRERSSLVKTAINVAKLSVATFALIVHCRKDLGLCIEDILEKVWESVKADVRYVAAQQISREIVQSEQKSLVLEGLGPLWQGGVPHWASPEILGIPVVQGKPTAPDR